MNDSDIQKDEHIHGEMYRKWIGIRVNTKEKRAAFKNEDLCRKYDTANKKRRRKRNQQESCVEDVFVIPQDFDLDHTIVDDSGMHIEEIRSLPSEDVPATRPSFFWRILGY